MSAVFNPAVLLLISSIITQQQGFWNPSGSSGAVCIHSALLPNDRLLCFERPHKDIYPLNAQTNGMLSSEINLKGTINKDGSWFVNLI
jgi:hypothetical protein